MRAAWAADWSSSSLRLSVGMARTDIRPGADTVSDARHYWIGRESATIAGVISRENLKLIGIGSAGTVLGGLALSALGKIFPGDWPTWLAWLQTIAQAISRAVTWLSESLTLSVGMPLWVLLAVGLAVASAAGLLLRRYLRMRVAPQPPPPERSPTEIINEKSAELSRMEAELELAMSALDAARARNAVFEEKLAPPLAIPADFKPTVHHLRAMATLLALYPQSVSLLTIYQNSRLDTAAHVELLLDTLVDAAVIERREKSSTRGELLRLHASWPECGDKVVRRVRFSTVESLASRARFSLQLVAVVCPLLHELAALI